MLLVLGWHRWSEALGGTGLAEDTASTAFGDPEPFAEHHDCSTAAGQKFPSASSFSIDLSSSASARSFFSLAFSFSSSFRR